MQKITDYMFVYGQDPKHMGKTVGEKIAEGWQPFGGVCVTPDPHTLGKHFAQALVKYEPQPYLRVNPIDVGDMVTKSTQPVEKHVMIPNPYSGQPQTYNHPTDRRQ